MRRGQRRAIRHRSQQVLARGHVEPELIRADLSWLLVVSFARVGSFNIRSRGARACCLQTPARPQKPKRRSALLWARAAQRHHAQTVLRTPPQDLAQLRGHWRLQVQPVKQLVDNREHAVLHVQVLARGACALPSVCSAIHPTDCAPAPLTAVINHIAEHRMSAKSCTSSRLWQTLTRRRQSATRPTYQPPFSNIIEGNKGLQTMIRSHAWRALSWGAPDTQLLQASRAWGPSRSGRGRSKDGASTSVPPFPGPDAEF